MWKFQWKLGLLQWKPSMTKTVLTHVIWKFQSSEKFENGNPRRLAELLQTIITEIMPSAG